MEKPWLRVVSSEGATTTLEVMSSDSAQGDTGPLSILAPGAKPLPYLRPGAKYLTLTENADGSSKIVTTDARHRFIASDWSQVQTEASRQLFCAVYDACENAGITVNRAGAQPVVELSPRSVLRTILTGGAIVTGFGVGLVALSLAIVGGNAAVGLVIDAAIIGGFVAYFHGRKKKKNAALKAATTARLEHQESSIGQLTKLEFDLRRARAKGMDTPAIRKAYDQTVRLLEELRAIDQQGPVLRDIRERFDRRYGWQIADIEHDLRAVLETGDDADRAAEFASEALASMDAYLDSEQDQVAEAHTEALDARARGIKNLTELDGVKRGE